MMSRATAPIRCRTGGVKDSGTGKEGVLSAMEDLTEEKVLVLTGIDVL